jgi:hypothetical protein
MGATSLLILYLSLAPTSEAPAGLSGPLSDDTAPPIGSLRYVTARMEIEFKQSTGQTAARIVVEIHNDSSKLISFHAVTAGNINGIAFNYNKVEFDGLIPAHESTLLISNRVTDIPIQQQTDIKDPSVVGIYEYDLAYKYIGGGSFTRRSAKGIRIEMWSMIERKPVGSETTIPVLVNFYHEVEE